MHRDAPMFVYFSFRIKVSIRFKSEADNLQLVDSAAFRTLRA